MKNLLIILSPADFADNADYYNVKTFYLTAKATKDFSVFRYSKGYKIFHSAFLNFCQSKCFPDFSFVTFAVKSNIS